MYFTEKTFNLRAFTGVLMSENEEIIDLKKAEETEAFFLRSNPLREYTSFEKQRMYEAKLAELQSIFSVLSDDMKKLAQDTIESVARMSVELKELELVNMKNGQVEKYNNGGGQKGNKASVSAEAYNKLKKTYLADMKFLTDLLKPDEDKLQPTDKSVLEKFAKMK